MTSLLVRYHDPTRWAKPASLRQRFGTHLFVQLGFGRTPLDARRRCETEQYVEPNWPELTHYLRRSVFDTCRHEREQFHVAPQALEGSSETSSDLVVVRIAP